MTRDELLESLLVERQDQTWWKTRAEPVKRDETATHGDNDIVRAARRKALLDEWERHFKRAAS